MADDNFAKKLIIALLFWIAAPFFNMLVLSLILPEPVRVIGTFINIALWPFIVLAVMLLLDIGKSFRQLFKMEKPKKRGALFLSLFISLLFSAIGGLLVAVFTANTIADCMLRYLPAAVVWGITLHILYRKNIFHPDDFNMDVM